MPIIVFVDAIATTWISKLFCDIKTCPTPLHAWPNQLLTLCLFQLFWVIDRQRLWWKTYFLRIIILNFLFTCPLTFSHWRQLKSRTQTLDVWKEETDVLNINKLAMREKNDQKTIMVKNNQSYLSPNENKRNTLLITWEIFELIDLNKNPLLLKQSKNFLCTPLN